MKHLSTLLVLISSMALIACGSDSDDGETCAAPAGPGIVDTDAQALQCQNACTWLAGCAVYSGECTGYNLCNAEQHTAVYDGCIETCNGPTGPGLLAIAKTHTTCGETIQLASGSNAGLAALCA